MYIMLKLLKEYDGKRVYNEKINTKSPKIMDKKLNIPTIKKKRINN